MASRINTGKRLGNNNLENLFMPLGLILFLFSGSFLITFIVSSQFMPVSDSSAADIAVVNTARGYYADISSLGGVSLETIASPEGTSVVGKDTLTIDTNAKNGYKLYISTISNATGAGLYPDNYDGSGSGSSNFIHPLTTGTTSSPVALGTNTWGYAPSRTNSSQTPTVVEEDDASFIGLPEYGSENLLYTNTSPTIASTNTLDVYYGTNTTTALPSGDYSNSVIYTAIVDGAIDAEGNQASINPSYQEGLAGGGTVTIATGLYPGFSMSDMGTITVTIGGDTCASPTPALSEIGSLNISCTAPGKTATGTYPVVVSIEKYDKTYNLEYEYKISTPAFFTITTMQEMTHAICTDSNLQTPTSTTSTTLTSDGANGTTRWSAEIDGVPQTTLLDDRGDGVSYTVRKLADGKCWMTENLSLAPGTTLTSTDSDVLSSYEIPANSSAFNTDQNANLANNAYADNLVSPYNYREGGHFTWRSATAGSGTTSMSSGTNTTVSICPKGWRLPTGGSGIGTTATTTTGSSTNLVNGDLYYLYTRYGGSGADESSSTMWNIMTEKANGPQYALAGVIGNAGRASQDSEGYYWSSTKASSSPYAYTFFLYQNPRILSQYEQGQRYGQSVRCVAR